MLRVLRGGSWNNHETNLRAAVRNRNQPDNRNDNIGFRVARDVERERRRPCLDGGLLSIAGAAALTAAAGVPFHFRTAIPTPLAALAPAASNINQEAPVLW
jgi:hypothetical protein